MKQFLKQRTTTLIIVLATLILAGIAIFTALRLFQLRKTTVAPTAPESRPGAQALPQTQSCELLSFTIPPPEVAPGCYETCSSTADCSTGQECQNVGGGFKCVNPSCSENSSCICDEASPSPSSTPSESLTPSPTPVGEPVATPSAAPELPEAGTVTPTLIGMGLGILVLLFSMALAL